ncbi:uncharacterized protein LOC120015210 isoform X2 [Tripterygium wilfordii]|uniref:uncharacterized protein LOC120015210 isoform X2 n=1 Tax=Tripterygium wilfordii TaxID=458696 RepID=UPI0018F7EA16|nr:uncharacterized protein LOC120015210 isoform X2 [Tripterygium wilfordii]
MPKGAKKRAAAKRKKELEANNHIDSSSGGDNPQGNDDVKNQDERESDGGETGSPGSQDQDNHQHPFKNGNEEPNKSNLSTTQAIVGNNNSVEGITGDVEGNERVGLVDDNSVQMERELKSKSVERNIINIDHIQSDIDTHDEYDWSSRTSSPDFESQVSERKHETPNILGSEAGSTVFGVKTADSLCKEEQVSEAPHLGDATSSLVTATAPVVDSGTPDLSTSVEAINVIESASLKNSAVHDTIQYGSKNNYDNLLPTSDEFIADSLATLDGASKENKDNVLPNVNENFGKSSAVVESAGSGNDGKMLTSAGTSTTETSNGAKYIDGSRVPDSSENQPLVESAPRMSQRTSCLSCCGLFDLIASSSR